MLNKICIIILVFFMVSCKSLLAYDGKVHANLNEEAANPDNSSLNDILINQLGFVNGIVEKLKKNSEEKRIFEWIAYGGEAEDFGKSKIPILKDLSTRAFNHFHDPLKDWDNAGLDHILNFAYKGRYWRDPVSSVIWGLNLGQQDFPENITGDWSWIRAREYYYTHLTGKDFTGNTVAVTQEERDAYFADCFRAVGQVMHLLQDASVPLHTRNDIHIFPIKGIGRWTYETYTEANKDYLDYTPDKSGDCPHPDLLANPNPDTDYSDIVPVSGLFDRNIYNEGSPIPASNAAIGLAEYSNANFLTQDTMWKYQHPNLDDTNIDSIPWQPESVVAEDGQIDSRVYIKFKEGVGEQDIERLAAFDYWTLEYVGDAAITSPFSLDVECWEDYADKLIPRAVGYSAALLDYFFRGVIEISLSDTGVYALTDKDPSITDTDDPRYIEDPASDGFDRIQFYAQNTSPGGEEMSNGTVTLVVKYRLGQGNQFQNPPAATSGEFYYITKEIPNDSIPRDLPVLFDIDLSDSQIPLWATDVYLYLVYKGQLGSEAEAVAVGYKDISEPTMLSYYNSMDKICIHEVLYDAGSPEAIAAVDEGKEDEWDVYSHDWENVYIKYSSFDNPQSLTPTFDNNNYKIPYLTAGEYLTMFILTDYQFSLNFSNGEIVPTDPNDNFDHDTSNDIGGIWGLTAIKNQIEADGRQISQFYQFRDIQNSWYIVNMRFEQLPVGSPDCDFSTP